MLKHWPFTRKVSTNEQKKPLNEGNTICIDCFLSFINIIVFVTKKLALLDCTSEYVNVYTNVYIDDDDDEDEDEDEK